MRRKLDRWLASAVLGHFLVTMAHGAAHQGAAVMLGPAGTLFVLLVIVLAPLAGLALSLPFPRGGGLLVAAAMSAALLFGLINHFVVVSPDHVSHVAVAWRPLFAATAVLLVVFEAAGSVAGWRAAFRRTEEWA